MVDGVIDATFWTEADALCVQVRDYGRRREPAAGPRPAGQRLGIELMHRTAEPTVDGLPGHPPGGTEVRAGCLLVR